MNHFVKAIAVVAIMGLMAVPARACSQHDQNQGSHRALTSDYIASPTLSAVPLVQQVHFRRGFGGRPFYGERFYYGSPRYYGSYRPWRYGWDYDYYYGRPWVGYYRPYYGGGVRVGPVGVWW